MSEAEKISLELPDGSRREYPAGVTGREVAESIGKRLAADALAVKLDDEIQDLARPIGRDGKIKILTPRTRDGKLDPDGLHVLRHSAAHVMAEAICKLWPETKLVYGPPVEDGFYYDVELAHKISADEFAKIEDEMKKIVERKAVFSRIEVSRDEGMALLDKEGNPYKIDNAQRADGQTLSFYVTGQPGQGCFEDLMQIVGRAMTDTDHHGAAFLTALPV
jgi:threonyl-tRNA synthetase